MTQPCLWVVTALCPDGKRCEVLSVHVTESDAWSRAEDTATGGAMDGWTLFVQQAPIQGGVA